MEDFRKFILLMTIFSFMSVGWGQDCPENMFWTDIGGCGPPTCSNPDPYSDPEIVCPDVIIEGCSCNFGFIFLYDNYWDPNNICIPIEDCPEEPSLCDGGYTEIDGECYYQSDLDVLQDFIDNSQGGNNPPPYDLSPIELGEQVWYEGRLINLCSSDFQNSSCQTVYELSGEIPSEIGNLTNLNWLNLYYNQLTGEIPPEIGNLTSLTYLNLENNELSGEIPSEIGNLTSLYQLILGYNQLTGEIPVEIVNLTDLGYLKLQNNYLTGSILPDNFEFENLKKLYLTHNNLGCYMYDYECDPNGQSHDCCIIHCDDTDECNGELPTELGDLVNLTYINLGYNHLTGSIPLEIGNLTNLTGFFLIDNQLTGSIPSEIGNLINLIYLGFSDNQNYQTLFHSYGPD